MAKAQSKKMNILNNGMHLSGMQIVLFALAFGLVGGLISWAAFAAPRSAQGQCTMSKDSTTNALNVSTSGLSANTYYDAQIYSYDTSGTNLGSAGNGANTTNSSGSFTEKINITDLTPYTNTASYRFSVYNVKGHKVDFSHEVAACTTPA